MVTTVQVKENTKEDLLVVKAKLETLSGKKHTLDDAIRWLLESSSKPSIEERIKLAEEFYDDHRVLADPRVTNLLRSLCSLKLPANILRHHFEDDISD